MNSLRFVFVVLLAQPTFAAQRNVPEAQSQIAQLEQEVAQNPEDLARRLKLVELYLPPFGSRYPPVSPPPPQRVDEALVQIRWMIENHPESDVTSRASFRVWRPDNIVRLGLPDRQPVYKEIAKLWLRQANAHRDDVRVIENALSFYRSTHVDPYTTEELVQRAIQMHSQHYDAGELSRLYAFSIEGVTFSRASGKPPEAADSQFAQHALAKLQASDDAAVVGWAGHLFALQVLPSAEGEGESLKGEQKRQFQETMAKYAETLLTRAQSLDPSNAEWSKELTKLHSAQSVPRSAADKTIVAEATYQFDPVAITRVTLSGADVQAGLIVSPREVQPVTPVPAYGEWLQNITFSLLNRTKKNIVYGQILLAFPESGAGSSDSPRVSYTISFGRRPPAANFDGAGQPMTQAPDAKPAQFAAGTTMVINVADYSDQMRRYFDSFTPRIDPNAFSKVIIRRAWFVFDDAMKWSAGSYSTPDPEHPGKWIPNEDRRYFPGRPTWPPGSYQRQ